MIVSRFIVQILKFTLLALPVVLSVQAAQEVQDHGVVAPVGQAGWSGLHSTVDGEGNRVILVKLWTGTGLEEQRRLLVINVDTGESRLEVPPVGEYGTGSTSGSFGTFLSRENRFYNVLQVNRTIWFMEYDVALGKWTACIEGPTHPGTGGYFANTFTEDEQGMIYAGILPTGELLAFDPETKELTQHGRFGNWNRRIDPVLSTDTAGWLYGVILYQQADVLAWKPGENEPVSLIPEKDKRPVSGVNVYRAANGKVYAQYRDQRDWYELYDGKLNRVSEPDPEQQLRRAGWRDPREFPDGTRIQTMNIPSKWAVVENADGTTRRVEFDYDSAGVSTYSVEAGPDGKIYGSTGIPLRFYRYDPETGAMDNWGLSSNGGHVNDISVQGDKLYGAVYGTGSLIVYDPALPWQDLPLSEASNPRELYQNRDLIGRPFAMLAHPDGEHVLMGGNPYRSKVGGGMVIYNVKTNQHELITPARMVRDQGVASLAATPDGKFIAIGTTVAPGTGGTKTAKAPYMLLFDWQARKVVGQVEVPAYLVADVLALNETQVIGITHALNEPPLLFVVDIPSATILASTRISGYDSLAITQGARVLSLGPDGNIYVLFRHHIVRVNPADLSAEPAVELEQRATTGSAWLGDRFYFTSGPRLKSWKLP